MKKILLSLSLALVLLTTACSDTTSFLYGDVIDKNTGAYVEGCQVTLLAADGTVLAVQQTGANGRWGFEVETGEYTVGFAKNGYAPIQEEGVVVEYDDTQVKFLVKLGENSSEIEIDWTENSGTTFDGGNGTEKDPYIIKTSKHLNLVNSFPEMHFKLANDIDLKNKNWKPIEKFSGVLDGNGYTISNLRVEYDDITYRGLIGTLDGGTVKNLNIKGVYIKGDNAGAIAGYVMSKNETISGCHVTLTDGSVLRGTKVGGIVGTSGYSYSMKCFIEDCTVESENNNVAINGTNAGGIAGYLNHCVSIKNCRVYCNVNGESNIGGITGYDGVIENCEYKGKISGTEYVGGICGQSYSSSLITASKAEADIEGDDYIGGLVGYHYGDFIKASYHVGTITASAGAKYIGGLTGENAYGTHVLFCYSATTCNHSNFVPVGGGGDYSTRSFSVYNTDNIVQDMEETYSDYAGYWDFNNIWTWKGKVNGASKQVKCPRLSWEN
jgi:hypothetical protein